MNQPYETVADLYRKQADRKKRLARIGMAFKVIAFLAVLGALYSILFDLYFGYIFGR